MAAPYCYGRPDAVLEASMLGREWATRSLRQGDLTALAAIARGLRNDARDRRERLVRRGFIKTRADESLPSVTVRGRLALLVRNLTRR